MTHAPTSMAAGWGRLWRSWLCFVALCGLVSVATAQIPGKDFDHLRTGFALTGTHSKARCESCHLGGVFKGTPRDCETCHVSGSRFAKTNVVKNTGHIPTTQTCDTCHNTRAFTGARMDHAGIAKGACSTCHNGTQATGKPNGHPVTTAACDSCHSPSAWRPVSNFDHSGIAAGTCATCHNGSKATGMGPNHTPFTQVGAIAGTACDSCHKSGFRAWTPAKLHSGVTVTAQCATCHTGLKPNNTVHAAQTVCEDCHRSTSSWSGTKVDHSKYSAATDCASCHNGTGGATGKGNAHIPVGGANCGTCHSPTGWKPSRWDHTQIPVSAQCASCHTGNFPPADGKNSNHTPFTQVAAMAQLNCDTCHRSGYVAWSGAKLHSSITVSAQCAVCHASSKPNNSVHSGQQVCENCHKSGATWSSTGKVDHSNFNAATDCAKCHTGNGATGKAASHIPVGNTNCASCHSASSWKPSRFDHTQVPVTAKCATCHTGNFPPADGKSATHTPYQAVSTLGNANCDTCHKAGYVAWTPAKLHSSVSVNTQCATCHTSNKPNDTMHAGQSVCEVCHSSTSTWSGAKVDHSKFNAATNCTNCHTGANGATAKPAKHVPVGTTNCVACHNTQAWKPSNFNHSQVPVTAQCATCHNGAFPPADGKSASHVPYQMVGATAGANCDACHKSGYVAWTPAKLHANVTVGAQCNTCHASIRPNDSKHTGQTACETCHSTTTWSAGKVDHTSFNAATNCTTCHTGNGATGKRSDHIPVGSLNCASCHGTKNWKPSNFNHTQVTVTGYCASCHTGTYQAADGKGTNHTPYQLVAATSNSNCDTCHKSGYTVWTGAKVHANTTISAQCNTCHASIKPSNAVHTGQTQCENCHKSTTTWSTGKVDHATFNAATNCVSCHNGTGGVTGKNSTHVPVGNTNCFACHSPTQPWKPTQFNHTQVTVTAQCATCHTGTYQAADGKGTNHTPYQLVGATSSANCDTCHKSGYAVWTGAKVHSNANITTQCATCHAGIKPNNATHSGQTTCEGCHKSTSTWSAGKVDHATFNAATNCASCHNGSGGVTGKNSSHVPVGGTNCIACHSPTQPWKPSGFNHTQVTVTAQCATCHTGTYQAADGKGTNHTPYQLVGATSSANCDTCHKSGYAVWTGAKVHSNANITTQCATCHASIKPNNATHTGQTTCEGCHKSTSTWSAGKVDHSTFGAATNCASCHNGTGGVTGKNSAHVPVGSTNCYACHSPTAPWKPSRFNHTQVTVTAQCATCHTGTYQAADGKGASHTPYQLVSATSSANCDTCHKSGYTLWTGAKVHANATITAQCATCHASIKPNNATHTGQTTCEGCHKSTSTWSSGKVDHTTFGAATNCASCHNGTGGVTGKNSAHVPVGSTNCYACHSPTAPWKPSRFNHTQVPVTAQCATCHTGTYQAADGRGASHTPYQLVSATAAANCDTCHKSGYTLWTGAKVHANATIVAQCNTCHASTKPNNATHLGQTVCENCHKSTSTWSGGKIDHSTFSAATNCASCHNGTGGVTGKNSSHVPVGATNCYGCHSPTTPWKPSRFNHTQVPVTAQCATCHTGTYQAADGKVANHIPYQLVTGATTANCDTCHKAGYTSWAGGKFHTAVTVTTQCKTCHNSTYASQGADAKTSNHIPETQLLNGAAMECYACHKSTTSWARTMDHNGSMGGGAGWCKGCHDKSTPYSAGMEKKSLTHEKKTPAAIDCSESGCHRPLGNKGSTYKNWD